MSNTIKVAAGFSVGNKEPIDDRTRVATIAERDAIVSYRRDIGLECIVQNDGNGNIKKYRLEGGITNSDWKDISENGVIETRSTNATANTIPVRDSNGNFQIKLPQDNIFIGNTFGFAAARPLPFDLTGQGGKAITVRADLLGYEYKSFPSGSLNTISVKSGVTGLTATKTGDNVELDATYPSTLVQSATGIKVLKDITSNKLSAATLVGGTGITITETTAETIGGIQTKNINLSASVGASNVAYNNVDYPTVESALNKLLYVPLTGTLTGGSTYEIGSTVSQVVLNWTYNKPVTTQSINNGIGSLLASLRTYTHSGQTITSNRTYTLTGSDGATTINSSTTVSFSYKRYWGTSATTTLTDANILALTREFSSSRVQNRVFDCTGSKYFWIIYPSSFGSAAFKVGGLSFSDMNLEVRTITNESGASVQLNIYRVNNIQTGSAINVEVS